MSAPSAVHHPPSTGRVLVIGAGGLGCPALLALAPHARTIGIVDDDLVELSNLNRQILHRTEDVGRPKVQSARDAVRRRFPSVPLDIETLRARVDADNVDCIVRGWDVIVDGTDSFDAKFLINDACVRAQLPLVHGAVVRFSGQLMSVVPGSACYRCLFEAPPPAGVAPSCQEAGIIGAFAGVVGGLMAAEALAILDGKPQLAGTLLVVDGIEDRRRRVVVRPRPGCEACSSRQREVA
ncbi:MAG TPA: HesA/MoeB/ThiF family protein [Polyangia bacterium]|jgi:adenylyltransferase/sulfurtransferase|nr:HesA/MoeB/ThiF family protein [Polyangia bacterium]